MSVQKRFIAISLIAAMGLGVPASRAQDLDDEIDAELDDSVEIDDSSSASADEVDLDVDDDGATATTDSSVPESGMAPETASTPAPVEDDGMDMDLDEGTSVAEPEASPAPAPEQNAGTEPSDGDIDLDNAIADDPSLDADPAADGDITIDDSTDVALPEATPAPQQPKRAASNLFSEPNEAIEKRFHRNIRNFRDVPDGDWEDVVGMRREELYPIQPRDTLWDISTTFFGEGEFWAKLWSQNDVIENPHLILRGKTIRFVAGTEAQAPAVGLTDSKLVASAVLGNVKATDTSQEAPTYREDIAGEITAEDLESGIALETSELIPAPEIPPPGRRTPLLKNLPPSFRERRVELDEGYDASGLRGAPAIRAREPAVVLLNSWVTDRTPDSLGTVVEIDAQEKLAGLAQNVIVKLKNPVDIGDRVTIARVKGSVSGAPGPVLELGGVAQIVGSVRGRSNTYMARIKAVTNAVEIGSLVLEDAPPTFAYSRSGRRAEAEVTVLGGEYDVDRKVIGEGSIIYLNGGSGAGLKVGDILGVQERRETRRFTTNYPDVIRPIGLLKIVDVRAKVATAVLLEAFEEVHPGDLTGGELPEPKPPIDLETAAEAVAPFKKKK